MGIVGSEALKFTVLGMTRAKALIMDLLSAEGVTQVVSGGCHLGGIDQWAAEAGMKIEITVTEFRPWKLSWAYYKQRNMRIANRSDVVHCITVDKLPQNFVGMRFPLCYHCGVDTHVKSGGCWTMKQAIKLGKPGHLHVIRNFDSSGE